jgi:hypothetical protein
MIQYVNEFGGYFLTSWFYAINFHKNWQKNDSVKNQRVFLDYNLLSNRKIYQHVYSWEFHKGCCHHS